jgi:hypothetical protein
MEVQPHSSLTSLVEVCDQLQAPVALPRGIDRSTHRTETWVGPKTLSLGFGEKKNPMLVPGIKQTRRPVSSPTGQSWHTSKEEA